MYVYIQTDADNADVVEREFSFLDTVGRKILEEAAKRFIKQGYKLDFDSKTNSYVESSGDLDDVHLSVAIPENVSLEVLERILPKIIDESIAEAEKITSESTVAKILERRGITESSALGMSREILKALGLNR